MAFFLQTVMGGLRLPLKADARIARCWTLCPHIRMLEVEQLAIGGVEECLQVHLSSSALSTLGKKKMQPQRQRGDGVDGCRFVPSNPHGTGRR